jgi:hypothetical protein
MSAWRAWSIGIAVAAAVWFATVSRDVPEPADPYRCQLHDLTTVDIEVAGLDVESYEVIEFTPQSARLHQLESLEDSKWPIGSPVSRPQHEVPREWLLLAGEPPSGGHAACPEHRADRNLDPTRCLDQHTLVRRDRPAQLAGKERCSRVDRRIAQVMMMLFQWISSCSNWASQELIHESGE